ncbi:MULTISPECIES: ribosome small subunit-dependent GTPase A [unclassified Mumia]|uniref:ribosome small subunit-dependent GTPase A n=1 Tax=unclassified Mumia TaxID=2621872 RepID=UPI001FB9A224|nr:MULTISPECIES: ribosome small subunit-dependent GTPase A [unclassified Mumia]
MDADAENGTSGGPEPWRGRVVRGDRGVVRVWTPGGEEVAVRTLAGADDGAAPCVGDWVLIEAVGTDLRVVAVEPRRSVLERAEPGGSSRRQVLAANIDAVAVVVGLDQMPSLEKVERLLVVAWSSGAPATVVLTKADLASDAADVAEEIATTLGVGVVVCSAESGDGVEEVAALAGGGTLALVGSSGAGKSSLVNALVGESRVATSAIRADGRGRHTTVRRELVALPGGGAVIDTPGLRGVGVTDSDGLVGAFADVEELTASCRFADCGHQVEPGCAVRAALDAGVLSLRRYESWRALQREAQWLERRADARLAAEQNRQLRRSTRAQRRMRRERGH